MSLSIRLMREDDLHGVWAVQRAVYPPPYHEDVSFVMHRRTAFPAGSFVVTDDAKDNLIVAYAQCYPWNRVAALESPPSLHDGSALDAIGAALAGPTSEAIMFMHEVTVWEQGRGLGRLLMEQLLQVARDHGFSTALLVAVLGNEPLWSKFGFSVYKELPYGYYAGGAAAAAAASAAVEDESLAAAAPVTDASTGVGLPDAFGKRELLRRPSFYSTNFAATVMIRQLSDAPPVAVESAGAAASVPAAAVESGKD